MSARGCQGWSWFTHSAAVLLAVCCTVSRPSLARSQVEPGRPIVLENGLTLLAQPLPGANNVALVICFGIGERHDPEGASGMGHLIEHLMTTCAAGRFPVRPAEQLYANYVPPAAGWNAQTGEHYTLFATVFPAANLKTEVEEHAARLSSLTIEQTDLDRERPRIDQELTNMFGAIPGLAAQNRARELATPSAEGARRGGVMEQINAITLEQVRARQKALYGGANAVVSVAGKLRPSDLELIKKTFAAVPRGEAPPPPRAAGAPHAHAADIAAGDPTGDRVTAMAIAAPAPNDPHYAAFVAIMSRLMIDWSRGGGGDGERFDASFAPLDDPGVAFIRMTDRADRLSLLDQRGTPEARLRARLKTVLDDAPGTLRAAGRANALAPMLGAQSMPPAAMADNPYFTAFAAARRYQMGIDGGAMARKFSGLSERALREAAAAVFGEDRTRVVTIGP